MSETVSPTSTENVVKRSRGGRHRIFTVEQRKDRNRRAQAAFRERRSRYTHTLEQTVVELESIIRELQESNRHTSMRAEQAEQRCSSLDQEVYALRQLLASVTAENLHLRSAIGSSVQGQALLDVASLPPCLLTADSVSAHRGSQTPPPVTPTTTITDPPQSDEWSLAAAKADSTMAIYYNVLFPAMSTGYNA